MAANPTTASSIGTAHSPLAPVARLAALDWAALVLMIVGSVNWGLVGAARFDLVAALFGAGSMLSRIVYVLVGLAGLYGIAMAMKLAKRG